LGKLSSGERAKTIRFETLFMQKQDIYCRYLAKKEGPPSLKKAEGQSFGHSPECTGSIDRPKVDVGYKDSIARFGEKTSEIYKNFRGDGSPAA
jgi:hypothetical protein